MNEKLPHIDNVYDLEAVRRWSGSPRRSRGQRLPDPASGLASVSRLPGADRPEQSEVSEAADRPMIRSSLDRPQTPEPTRRRLNDLAVREIADFLGDEPEVVKPLAALGRSLRARALTPDGAITVVTREEELSKGAEVTALFLLYDETVCAVEDKYIDMRVAEEALAGWDNRMGDPLELDCFRLPTGDELIQLQNDLTESPDSSQRRGA